MRIKLRTGVFRYDIEYHTINHYEFYDFIEHVKEKYDCYHGIILYWDKDVLNVVVYDDYWE